MENICDSKYAYDFYCQHLSVGWREIYAQLIAWQYKQSFTHACAHKSVKAISFAARKVLLRHLLFTLPVLWPSRCITRLLESDNETSIRRCCIAAKLFVIIFPSIFHFGISWKFLSRIESILWASARIYRSVAIQMLLAWRMEFKSRKIYIAVNT